MIDSNDDRKPRRESPTSVLHSRAAKGLIADAHEHLGDWQAETIKLETSALRLDRTRRPDPSLAAATRSLLNQVAAQAAALNLAASTSPAEIATHSRVTDTLKIMELLTRRLEKLLETLGETR